jgi:hypothetical protein
MSLTTATALLCAACAAPRQAAQLADITSAHINTLNTQMQSYVSNANDSSKNDALLLASTQQYFQSLEDETQGEVRAWRANPGDPNNKDKIAAFDSLQQDAIADMATTDSSIKQQGNRIASMEANYGQLAYSTAQVQSIMAALQTLAKRSSNSTQVSTFYSFSDAVLQDAKNGLQASSPNPAGVVKKKTP